MMKSGWIVPVAVLASLAIGCGKDRGPRRADRPAPAPATAPAEAAAPATETAPATAPGVQAPAGTNTPKDAVLSFATAWERRDKAMLLACVQAGPKERAALETMFDWTTTMMKFQESMVKAYGKDALDKTSIRESSGFPKAAQIERGLRIIQAGDKAAAVMEGTDKPLQLIRIDGVWKIDASAMSGQEDAQNEQMAAMARKMTRILEEVTLNVGLPGVTPEWIDTELRQKMLAAGAPAGSDGPPPAPEAPASAPK
ncbi:MAG: hypothetical protein NT031_13840 [Planctomycetota bacterium]|nr:hypothetical protein [Planctomycetota bacterium]